MKFKINSSALLKKLNIVNGAIASNPILPILEDFLFSIKENKLTLSSTDLECSIMTTIDVVSDSNGTIAVPAKLILDTLKSLPNQELTITCNEQNGVEIKSASGKYKMMGENGLDYPSTPDIEDATSVTIQASLLQNGINQTLFATSNDDLRPAMTGVYFELNSGLILMTATDAHKLSNVQGNVSSEYEGSFILPKKALSILKTHLSNSGDVKFTVGKNHCQFEFGEITLTCRLIDQKYPNYRAVLPTENKNTLTVNRAALQSTLKRIAIYANKTTNQVVFTINENNLVVSAQDLDFSNEANEQVVCSYQGEPITIGFNAKFLIEMLGVIDSDEIKIELSKPTRAAIIRPVDVSEEYDLLMLAMPVVVSN
jgi:DNA polymerase III subunit beta